MPFYKAFSMGLHQAAVWLASLGCGYAVGDLNLEAVEEIGPALIDFEAIEKVGRY